MATRAGKCGECGQRADYYHRIEFSYSYAGIPIIGTHITYRCNQHTVKPYYPVREKSPDGED